VELVTSNSEKGVEEDTCRWDGNVIVEERRRRREYILTGEERLLEGEGGVVDVDLIS